MRCMVRESEQKNRAKNPADQPHQSSRSRLWLILLIGALAVTGGAYWLHRASLAAQAEATEAAAKAFADLAYRSERGFIESLPIYADYASAEKEAKLRRYLLADHLDAANRFGVEPVADESAIQKLAAAQKLVVVENTPETGFYFYNVPKRFRYLTPAAASGLNAIADRLQQILNEKERARLSKTDSDARDDSDPRGAQSVAVNQVKFAVSSMLRPTGYQTQLRDRNTNASLVSSHSQGVSFDIFYDEYFVRLPDPAPDLSAPEAAVQEALKQRVGYLLGASLRRQFRAALTETLLQLQDEGLVYVILEKRQRCYHVTVLR